MKLKRFFPAVLMLGALLSLWGCSLPFTGGGSAPTQDAAALAQETAQVLLATQGAAPAPTASAPIPTRSPTPPPATPTPTPLPTTGSVSGRLTYPGDSLPPLRVVAFSADSEMWYSVEVSGQGTYLLGGLPPGSYHVVAYVMPNAPGFPAGLAGGYTQAVICGLSDACKDHSLIVVSVKAGDAIENISPGDWYAPQTAFPPDPASP